MCYREESKKGLVPVPGVLALGLDCRWHCDGRKVWWEWQSCSKPEPFDRGRGAWPTNSRRPWPSKSFPRYLWSIQFRISQVDFEVILNRNRLTRGLERNVFRQEGRRETWPKWGRWTSTNSWTFRGVAIGWMSVGPSAAKVTRKPVRLRETTGKRIRPRWIQVRRERRRSK